MEKGQTPPPYGKFHKKNVFFIESFPKTSSVGTKKIPQCGIQDFPALLTFSFKAYQHVLILKKGFQREREKDLLNPDFGTIHHFLSEGKNK